VDLRGAVTLVTGGASGMGAATARMVIEEGGEVAILDLAESGGGELASALGPSAQFFPTDVADTDQVGAAFDGVLERFGRLDLTVNAAGVAGLARFLRPDGEMYALDRLRHILAVNLVGVFDVVRRSARAMRDNEPDQDGGRGVIVNIGSTAAFDGQVGQVAYSASKGGVVAMTLPLARELASVGIRVVTICPSGFDTGMLAGMDDATRARLVEPHVFPKRLGDPHELALLVRAIAENPMLNGEVIRLDAASRLPPS
jgi:3-hydroxyacyl-CoA dehydrogenase/3-hydroxy-2-methylbutyryl-CoA dehydrogenase